MKKRIAILASQDHGPSHPYPDDVLLLYAFEQLGHRAHIICWDDEAIDYQHYDAAIVRSCWDYDQRLPEFMNRLAHIHNHTVLLNPYEIIRENADKQYLLTLEQSGVPVVPTLFIQDAEDLHVPESWKRVIVKPTVSASGRDTSLHVASDPQGIHAAIAALTKKGKTAMLQEYQPSIEEYGERSSVMIAGETTFTMKKTPKDGNFLVHKHHGGTYIPVETTLEEERFLDLLIQKIAEAPLYMRVDYLRCKDGLICLLELEQIEPNLYLHENAKGLGLLVQETLNRI